MKQIVLAVCLAATFTTIADAANKRVENRLDALDPMTRLDQVCALEAMTRIRQDDKSLRPDRAITYALSAPEIKGSTMTGKGGALRSKGQWYRYSFTCKATPDHKTVSGFTYKLGAPIPEDQWETYGLFR
jgi:hypothetical protein